MTDKRLQKDLANKYKNSTAKKLSLSEFEKIKEKEAKKKRIELPAFFKYILLTPVILILCFGLFYLPYILFIAFTAPKVEIKEKKKTAAKNSSISYDKLMKKK